MYCSGCVCIVDTKNWWGYRDELTRSIKKVIVNPQADADHGANDQHIANLKLHSVQPLSKRNNGNVHRAAANIIVSKSRAARGSVCNVLLSTDWWGQFCFQESPQVHRQFFVDFYVKAVFVSEQV